MKNDDRQVGRIVSRREALVLLGAAGATFLAACVGQIETELPPAEPTQPPTSATTSTAPSEDTAELPPCIVRPEMTTGPFFVDEQLNRSDIRSEPSDNTVREGVQLELIFRVSQIANSGCKPLAGAHVDVWHCDALGVYSGVSDPVQGADVVEKKFLRGYQITDENGTALFTTIYPG